MSQNNSEASVHISPEIPKRPTGLNPISVIGEGAYSSVFTFKDSTGVPFARKIFKDKVDWEKEKLIYSRIANRSFSIVYFLGAETETEGNNSAYFIDFELAIEGTLWNRVNNRGAGFVYGEDEVIQWLIDILKGLEYLHDHMHLAHNDLKSENILLVMHNGILRAKISDLGAAENPDKLKITDPLNEGPVTPGYGPPELYMENRLVYASDTWSLGSIAYEMVTGCNAFFEGISKCTSEIERTRTIVANVLAMDTSNLKIKTSRFPISKRLHSFITKVLLEKDWEIRMRPTAVLMTCFIRRRLAEIEKESLRDREFRQALEEIQRKDNIIKQIAADLKKKNNDLLMTNTSLQKRTKDLNETANQLQDAMKKINSMAKRPTVDAISHAKRKYVQSESEDEEVADYRDDLLHRTKLLCENPPEEFNYQWVLQKRDYAAKNWSSMRIKHIIRLYSIPDLLEWIPEHGPKVLDLAEYLLARYYKIYVIRNNTTNLPLLSHSNSINLSAMIHKQDGEEFSIFEKAIITILYIVLMDATYVYRHLITFTKRSEDGIRRFVKQNVAHGVDAAESFLLSVVGQDALLKIDAE